MKKIKTLFLSLLALSTVAISVPMAVFADTTGNTDINIQAESAVIDVTVPASTQDGKGALTFVFNADGTNTLPDNWTITNNSAVDVKLTTLEVTGNDGWELVASGDAKLSTTDAKAIHLVLDNAEQSSGVYTLNQTITKNGGTHTIAIGVDGAQVGRPAYSKAVSVNKAFSVVQHFTYAD